MPFAVDSRNLTGGRWSRWRTPVAVLVLGAGLLASLSGVLGGGPSRHLQVRRQDIAGELIYDPVVRSGNWFETQVTIRPSIAVKDLTIAVDDDLWRRMSIDTIVPDAESTEALNGRYAFHFGEVKAGETFRLKLDGQIQPGLPREQAGAIHVLEGATEPGPELLSFPVHQRVLP